MFSPNFKHLLPLKGDPLRKNFPTHQMGLPSHIYDVSPDGWACSRILVAIQVQQNWWLFSPSLPTFQLSSFPTSPGYNNGHPKYD